MKKLKIEKALKKSLFLLGMLIMFFVPFQSKAATQVSATIDQPTLTQSVSKPYVSGTATGVSKIWMKLYKEGETKKYYYNKSIKVKNGVWKSKISKNLKDGNYKIEIKKSKNSSSILTSGILVIDKNNKTSIKNNSSADLVIASVPLLSGGSVSKGQLVPISYLQVNNIGKNYITIKGFKIKQNGSASENVVVELSIVDDKGGSRMSINAFSGESLFKNGLAIAPTDAVMSPGQMKLFTIKAGLSNEISANIGKNLMIDVVGVESNGIVRGTFPIRGTTWNISN